MRRSGEGKRRRPAGFKLQWGQRPAVVCGALGLVVALSACGSGGGYGASSGAVATSRPSGSSGGIGAYGSSSGSNSAAGSSTTPSRSPAGRTVTVGEINGKFAFVPHQITVKPGTTVLWRNKSAMPHTVTSDVVGGFNKSLGQGGTVSVPFSKPGTYTYHCSIHPYMHGVIVVTK